MQQMGGKAEKISTEKDAAGTRRQPKRPIDHPEKRNDEEQRQRDIGKYAPYQIVQ